MPAAPPDPEVLTTFDYLVQIGGAISVAFMAWLGTRRKPEPPATATVSAAMVDNRVVDPLVLKLDALGAAIDRLCALTEQEVRLRQTSAEDARKAEEAKRLAVVVADAVRDDLLSEVRAEFHKNEPAAMPPVRGRP